MPFPKKSLEQIFANPPANLDMTGLDVTALDTTRVPEHVAVIMDGNGRWAEQRGKNRAFGHKAGIKGVRELIRTSNDIGIRYLTIYSFSTENWSRPLQEVKTLMNLFANTMAAELDGMHKEAVRIKIIGDMSALPSKTRKTFENAVAKTADNLGMTLIIAVNYGSRTEIARAVRTIAQAARDGKLTAHEIEQLDEIAISNYLQTAGIPDPDLLVRTSGEYRLSNFLLYQIAYSELYVTQTLWPDFDRFELLRALLEYQKRARRYGGVQSV